MSNPAIPTQPEPAHTAPARTWPITPRQLATDARKFLAAATIAVGEAANLGLLHGSVQHWTSGVLVVAEAFVVYLVPNGTSATTSKGLAP